MKLETDIHLKQGAFVLDAAFSAPAGITALFGPSGSGKSTLLRAIAGLTRARGRAVLDGRPLDSLPAHGRGIGMVFQDARLFPHLSVRGNLLYAQRRARRPRELELVARFFDIAALLDRPVTNLSGGEKSRVALARALVAAPDLLLLDEPFAALDGPRRNAFITILREAHEAFGISMLAVTHSIEDACALAGHVVGLRGGTVVAAGPFAETARMPAFRQLLDVRDIGVALPAGQMVSGYAASDQSLWLRADQVLLAARRPEAISARNILEGRVVAILAEAGGSRLVELETGAGAILSRLTPEAVRELQLTPGCTAWAVFKAHAL
jgi:molybdate transport system ATP-binding protein